MAEAHRVLALTIRMHDRRSKVVIPFLVAFEPFKFWVIQFQVNSNPPVGLNSQLQNTNLISIKIKAHNITTTTKFVITASCIRRYCILIRAIAVNTTQVKTT